MTNPMLVIDWDGTLVEDAWPEEGDWLPGAVEALRELTQHYTIYVFSCRVAEASLGDWDTPRPPEVVERERAYVRRMLDEAGFPEVGIWLRDFKPPAVAYIDNRAIRFDGNWREIVNGLR